MARTFTPSPQQSAIFAAVQDPKFGSFIVDAKAGAGKTTTIVEATKLMSGTVFLGAYNTKMAKELKERIAGMNNVRAGTFHSIGFGALRRAVDLHGDPDGKKLQNIFEAECQRSGRMDLKPMMQAVVATTSMAKQRGIGALPEFPDTDLTWLDMIAHFGLDDDLPEPADDSDYEALLEDLVMLSRHLLTLSEDRAKTDGYIDFDDMVYLPLKWNLRLFQNDWVLVDEAQDTNPTRRALARKMLRPKGRLIAVGDPNQAIYGFSGADNDALDQIGRDFGARKLSLGVTYRCPKAVVAVAQRWVSDIEAHETAPVGAFSQVRYKDLIDFVKPGDAILCRYNKYLVGFAFKLIRNGIPARIEGKAIGQQLIALINKWRVATLPALSNRVVSWRDREAAKAEAKKQDTKADQIRDRAETVLVLIERALEQNIDTVSGLRHMVESMFDDRVVERKDMVTLCSVHRSKGLEWPRVFVLGLEELMGKERAQEWETIQERNLQYVAATRAQNVLVDVIEVKEEGKQHSQENDA